MLVFGNKLPFGERARRKKEKKLKKGQHHAREIPEFQWLIKMKILEGIFLKLICNGDFLCKTRKVLE